MLNQKKWIDAKYTADAEKFFTEKIPKVLSDELTAKLSSILGLKS